MDYLTFITVHTMMILSLCGVVYLCKEFIKFVRWVVRITWKELKEDG